MQLVKKFEKPILRNAKTTKQVKEQNFSAEIVHTQELTISRKEELFEREHYYAPASNNFVIQSLGNSGWQVSDIWKDVRLDDF